MIIVITSWYLLLLKLLIMQTIYNLWVGFINSAFTNEETKIHKVDVSCQNHKLSEGIRIWT